MQRDHAFDMYNAAYVQAAFEQYLQNPASVDDAWRRYFSTPGGRRGLLGAERDGVGARADGLPGAAAPTISQFRAARAAGELVDAYRLHGHRAAQLDPLGSPPHGHPMLTPEFHGTTEEELDTVPAEIIEDMPGTTMHQAVAWLRETYTGTIGYEFEHLEEPGRREWVRAQIEEGAHRQPLSAEEKRRLLRRLTEVEGFEQFLHRAYLGAKRFSIEGTDMMVPMLDLAIERASLMGAREVVIGMAHRGRLNVLAHVLGMSYRDLLAKFEGRHAGTAGTGDVKYHLGADGTYATRSGEPLTVSLAPNPSHLEFVHPVVEGMTRAKQSDRRRPVLTRDQNLVVPIIIHGDAAFPAQGVVAETLNLAALQGYHTGGTLHIIANNQVGFTTEPSDARSTDYASDLAKGFDIPVLHVNADDADACLAVVRLAMMYREEFHGDVVIDLIGYRRFGHNEGDEPAYTQPLMYNRIAAHPPVRRIWAARLAQEGVIAEGEEAALWQQQHDLLLREQEVVRGLPEPEHVEHEADEANSASANGVQTAVPADRLLEIDRQLHSWPAEFSVHPKLARQLERRGRVLPDGGSLDWAHAESLAFGSLLMDGTPIRLTGQDVQRGTFSQRHLVLHDTNSPRTHIPLATLPGRTVPFEVCNSPLSELATVGFEYGYSVMAPRALVLWEAQFGDFVNGAQIIVDQFIAAGRTKWEQHSRLVLLLPHGYEGQGPEHSSARLERFLQLAAESNLRAANCTTPAQYFHLLRRQALLEDRRPLVVMTPKSLLRHPQAVSSLPELSAGRFHKVIDDPAVAGDTARRVLLCTGKVYYDLLAGRAEESGAEDVAIVRVELLYPFPATELRDVLGTYRAADVCWVQEEPENMGAWPFMADSLRGTLGRDVRYIGRRRRASPAEGYAETHAREQARIVAESLAGATEGAGRSGRRTRA